MIKLHPTPSIQHKCPHCDVILNVDSWYIPGMRNLAILKCNKCSSIFYGDLLSGHGLHYPVILEKETGNAYDNQNIGWFSHWLLKSYQNRTCEPIEISIEKTRPIKKPLILNCLDTLYGHSLLKLLNAQFYIDHCPGYDLILFIPRFLSWMVPEGAAEVWTIDLPLKRGIEWNDWLAEKIKHRFETFESCWLSVAFPHPDPNDFSIERFTGIEPFNISEWTESLKKPTITFVWRDDRCWWDEKRYASWRGLSRRLKRRLLRLEYSQIQRQEQTSRIIILAGELKRAIPNLDFSVAGLGLQGGLPDWIHDIRTTNINVQVEKNWCKRYSESNVVIGIHGSNMLLPSAHSGAVVELVPDDRWNNIIQDILISEQGERENLFRFRLLPLDTSIKTLSIAIISLLRFFPDAFYIFNNEFTNHDKIVNFTRDK
ncbi:hypothetical protein ACFL1N_02030 [Thermodesulfobacteriota bacterium]